MAAIFYGNGTTGADAITEEGLFRSKNRFIMV